MVAQSEGQRQWAVDPRWPVGRGLSLPGLHLERRWGVVLTSSRKSLTREGQASRASEVPDVKASDTENMKA